MVQGWHRTQVPAGGRNVHLVRDDAGKLVLVVCANQVTESPERSATAQQFNDPIQEQPAGSRRDACGSSKQSAE